MAFGYERMVDTFLDGFRPKAFTHLDDAAAFIKELPVLALNAVTALPLKTKRCWLKMFAKRVRKKHPSSQRKWSHGSMVRRQEIESAVKR